MVGEVDGRCGRFNHALSAAQPKPVRAELLALAAVGAFVDRRRFP